MKINNYYEFHKEFGESVAARIYFNTGNYPLDIGDFIRLLESDISRLQEEIDKFDNFWTDHLKKCNHYK